MKCEGIEVIKEKNEEIQNLKEKLLELEKKIGFFSFFSLDLLSFFSLFFLRK